MKYYYEGMPLRNYCTENGISYNAILKRINRLKEKEPNLSNEELVEISINGYKQNQNQMEVALNKLDEESSLPAKHKYVDQHDNYSISDASGQDIKYVDVSEENLNSLRNNEKIKKLNIKN